MTHLLSLTTHPLSEACEVLTHNHAPTFNSPAHRRTNFWLDPLLDNYLNPAKGETLWFEKNKWIQISGYKDPFKVPGDLEISLSPIAFLSDYFKMHAGLMTYTHEKLDTANLHSILLKTPYLVSPVALTVQAIILFELTELTSKIGLARTMNFLNRAETDISSRGVRRSYINIENGKGAMGPLFPVVQEQVELTKSLLNHGYQLIGEFHHLLKNTYEQRFYKEFPNPALLPNLTVENTDFEWIQASQDQSLPPEQFGIYTLKKGKIKGGLFCLPNIEGAFIPHTYLNTFWIDPSIRGTGLGSRIINLTFDYSKQRGAEVVELGTMDFQAPLFYEKMGFQKIQTDPNILVTRDGKLNNGYLYRKYL